MIILPAKFLGTESTLEVPKSRVDLLMKFLVFFPAECLLAPVTLKWFLSTVSHLV